MTKAGCHTCTTTNGRHRSVCCTTRSKKSVDVDVDVDIGSTCSSNECSTLCSQ
jgi:hypothetical protein